MNLLDQLEANAKTAKSEGCRMVSDPDHILKLVAVARAADKITQQYFGKEVEQLSDALEALK